MGSEKEQNTSKYSQYDLNWEMKECPHFLFFFWEREGERASACEYTSGVGKAVGGGESEADSAQSTEHWAQSPTWS